MTSKRLERRLAAILAADIVGYSRLMGADEEGTLARVKALRSQLIDRKIAEHHGRIVKTTGDGLLAEFGSVVDAVRCAVETQREILGRNETVPAEQQIRIRIGINVGDIIVDEGDIFGDGVNIAARLEALAEPGGICVSQMVHEQVRNKLAFGFEDLGQKTVKNIALPVHVFSVHSQTVLMVGRAGSRLKSGRSPNFRGLWIAGSAVTGFAVLALGLFSLQRAPDLVTPSNLPVAAAPPAASAPAAAPQTKIEPARLLVDGKALTPDEARNVSQVIWDGGFNLPVKAVFDLPAPGVPSDFARFVGVWKSDAPDTRGRSVLLIVTAVDASATATGQVLLSRGAISPGDQRQADIYPFSGKVIGEKIIALTRTEDMTARLEAGRAIYLNFLLRGISEAAVLLKPVWLLKKQAAACAAPVIVASFAQARSTAPTFQKI